MKIPPALLLTLILGAGSTLSARPIDYKEISLLVRFHESEPSIVNEVSQRKLARPLTSQQETILRSQGATDDLLQNLRNRNFVVSNAEAAADSERAEQTKNRAASRTSDQTGAAENNVHIIDVSLGHPINLSQWGGPDSEIQFNSRRCAGEDIIEPVATSPWGNFVHTATYLGAGRAADDTTIFDDRNYVSIMAHDFSSRPLHIDQQHPVSIENVPYLLYPLCATRGVSLYYIGAVGGSVRLAAITN